MIEYGAVAYDNAAPSHKKQLQSIQTTALRICCGAFKSTAATALQVDCGEMPLDLSRKRQQLIYAAKIKSQKNHPNAGILEDHWTKHYGRYKPGNEPWSTRVTDIIEQLNIQPTDMINAPPWENKSFLFDTKLSKEKLTNPLKNEKSNSLINKHKDKLAIYTDSARSKEERAAIAFHIPVIRV